MWELDCEEGWVPKNWCFWTVVLEKTLFFFFLLYFTLQYCIGFAIHQHESATGIHVFPIPNSPPTSSPHHHPSGSSQCTSPKHPAPCIKSRLAIHFLFDTIHVSMPFSQIIPPSPSPTKSKRLFFIYFSLADRLKKKKIATIYVRMFHLCFTLGVVWFPVLHLGL